MKPMNILLTVMVFALILPSLLFGQPTYGSYLEQESSPFRQFYGGNYIDLLSRQPISGSYLEPEHSPFGRFHGGTYFENIKRVLYRPIDGWTVVQMVTLPSFQPEHVTGIFVKDERFFVFSVRSTIHLYRYQTVQYMEQGQERIIHSPDEPDVAAAQRKEIKKLKQSLPKKIDDVKIVFHKAPLSRELFDVIHKTWRAILRRTRYGEHNSGLDGTRYHFMVFESGTGEMSGQTWSPSPGTINDRSVQLGYLLEEYAIGTNTAVTEKAIRALCDTIITMIYKEIGRK